MCLLLVVPIAHGYPTLTKGEVTPGDGAWGSLAQWHVIETWTGGIKAPKKLTSLACEVNKPKPTAGETIVFSGYLRTSDENLGIAGKNLVLYKLLRENEVGVGSAVTDDNGYFILSLEAPSPGISFYKVQFLGDNYYEASESARLYLNTLNEAFVLGISAVILLLVVGSLIFLFSRGMVRAQYLRFVLLGSGVGIFLELMRAGFLSPLAAGGVAGYLFARETRGWTKHLRVGCMAWLLVLPLVGILYVFFFTESPEFFAYSITQSEFITMVLYLIILSLMFLTLVAGLAATIGGMLRGGLKPQKIEGTEQTFARP